MVGVHRHDVVELGDRPEGAVFVMLGRVKVDGVLLAKPLEVRPDRVVPPKLDIGHVDVVQGQGIGLRPRFF